MNFGTLAALGSAWLLGLLLVAAVRPVAPAAPGGRTLLLAIGLLLGLAGTSGLFFFATLVSARPALVAGAGELIAGLGLLGWLARRPRVAPPAPGPAAGPSWLRWLLASALAQAVLVAAVCGWRAYQAEPYGGWDAWAIWNLHARALLRAGAEWPALLAEPMLHWTHPDYPRLVASAVARAWAWTGAETPAASALVSAAFAAGALGVLLAVAARIRGWTLALAAGLALVGTPFFVTFAPGQHADLPLAAYLLAAVGLLLLGATGRAGDRGWLLLAGAAAGCAAWTKNEGLLFALVFAAAGGVALWRRDGWRGAAALAAGLGGALVPVAVFKLGFAPANDLLSAPLGPRLGFLTDGARHLAILAALGRDLVRFGEWSWPPYLALALPFVAWRARRRPTGAERLVLPLVALMLAGYYLVYLTTPQDLAWHLDTSLVRLLLQLWPLALLGWVLALPAVDAAAAAGGGEGPRVGADPALTRRLRAVFFALNFAAAFALTSALSRQPASNELALGRGRTAGVTVALGAGWHAPERHGRDRWAWSGGRATLLLHAAARREATVTLRFGLRSSGRRVVTVSQAGRILWQGEMAGELVRVELPGLAWPEGVRSLEFATDTPGIAEAPGDGGRSLAFALYNAELR